MTPRQRERLAAIRARGRGAFVWRSRVFGVGLAAGMLWGRMMWRYFESKQHHHRATG